MLFIHPVAPSILDDIESGPRFRGGFDSLKAGILSGWVVDLEDFTASISFKLVFDDIIIADASTVKRRFDLDKYILHNIAGFSFKLESLDLVDWQALINRLETLSDEELAAPCRLAVLVDGGKSGFEIGRTGVTNADFLDQLTRIFPRDIGATSPDSDENHSLEESEINIPALPNQDERLQPSIVPPITVSTEMEATAPSEPLNVFGDSSVTDLPLYSEIAPPVDAETSVILNSLTHVPGGGQFPPTPELAQLADLFGEAGATLKNLTICIVTNELAEFHQNGGLGTANSGLVHALGKRGFAPTVLYSAKIDLESVATKSGIADLRRRGVEFLALQEMIPKEWMDSAEKISYACYWFLRDRSFDIAHFNDYLGNGFYSAQARRSGAALHNTTTIITVHGPTRWAQAIDEVPAKELYYLKVSLLEHKALEYADAVIGVSHHLISWLRGQGVQLPKHTYVHKNILPAAVVGGIGSGVIEPGQLADIVFFARQDIRKGFLVMLDAIRRVSVYLPNVKFTFLGKFSRIYGEHSGAVAFDELSNVPNLIEFKHDYDRDRAIMHLRRPGTLAVMPSLDENSPCTIFECVVGGIPFIASDVGGVPELVAPEDWATALIEPDAESLSIRILEIARNGMKKVSLGFNAATIEEQMFRGFAALHFQINQEHKAALAAAAAEKPLVSVVITHFNRPAMLKNLLRTLEKQTYSNYEVIVVDDGSTQEDAVAFIKDLPGVKYSYPLTVVPITHSYLGAARNAGVRHATGEFLKFQDDDNLPMPIELEYFVRAALMAKADVVTAMSRFFRTEQEIEKPLKLAEFEYFPFGASLPASLYRNLYGDANALVRRASFIEDGGFTELRGVGFEDYEFFLKSESLGRKLIFVPEPIFNYRVSEGGMLRTTSAYRGAKRVLSGLRVSNERWMAELADFTQDMQLSKDLIEQAWLSAGRRKHGGLHQQMLEGDASSKENVQRFLDLAVHYERLEDVLKLVFRGNSIAESFAWMEKNARNFDANGRDLLGSRPQIIKFDRFKNIKLLQPTVNLPNFNLVTVKENGMLVHPLTGRTVEAIIPGAVTVGTKRLSVPFNHRGPSGSSVHAQIEVSREGKTVVKSEWVLVAPGQTVDSVIAFDTALTHESDLVLKTKVAGSQAYCWVYAEFLRLETVSSMLKITRTR